ncbi:MAG: alkaline phosphatase [Bacteroidota bacterium]|nr:alkaline phosphatase [Bacteroidota bacterium]
MKLVFQNIVTVLIFIIFSITTFAQKPRNLILFIGDGFGIAPKTAARMAMGQGSENKRYYSDPAFQVLALDKLKYTAMATTHSLNSWTTDSAPGATVYSTGQKVDNEMIAFDPLSGQPLETVLEAAKKAGYAVGLVTTTRITHATPASFGSHIWHRDLEDYIAAQLISSSQKEYEEIFNISPIDSCRYKQSRDWILPPPKLGVEIDVLLGGGAKHFLPNGFVDTVQNTPNDVRIQKGERTDKVNLINIAKKRGYQFVNNRNQLASIDIDSFRKDKNKKLLGIFKSGHISYEQDRQLSQNWEPSLSEMTEIAIKVLSAKSGKKGFFLMVEGGRIDHLGHANAGILNSSCRIETDSVAFPPDGGNERLKNTFQGDIYGSDYLIKEVLSFDYAVEAGRKLLQSTTSETLILSTSDHECGAIAILGLSSEGKIRTYASEPQSITPLSANPKNFTRGHGNEIGWFPQYELYEFQGKKYPKPINTKQNRIVITYASNPSTLGIGCGGNHTPQDVWVGADDNLSGKYASMITGKGMLDNTSLHKIMIDFLRLKSSAKQ